MLQGRRRSSANCGWLVLNLNGAGWKTRGVKVDVILMTLRDGQVAGITQGHQGGIVGRVDVALIQYRFEGDEGDGTQNEGNADSDYHLQQRVAACFGRCHKFFAVQKRQSNS